MKKEELIEKLSEITEVTSRNGLHYTIRVSSEKTDIMFKRSAYHEEEKLSLEELLTLINSNKSIDTKMAKEYISGRKQSPAVAIIDTISKLSK